MKEKLNNLKNIISSFFNKKTFKKLLKNKKYIGIVAAGLLLIIIVLILSNGKKTSLNSGNLNNLGFALKKGKWTYFQGFDEGAADGIYRIKGNKIEKVSDDYAMFLNSSGKYLYYLDVKTSNLVKMKKDGQDKSTIIQDIDARKITIKDNWIYFFDDASFYKIKTNGNNKTVLSTKTIESYEIVDNWIYYSYKNNGKYEIEKMKLDGSKVTKIDDDASKAFFVNDNKIYYITENFDYDSYSFKHELYSMKMNGKNKKKIADLSENIELDSINFADDKIYYVSADNEYNLGIYKIKLNGKNEEKITDLKGYTTNINIYDNWIYYLDISDNGDTLMYRIKTNGKDKQSLELK